MRGRQKSRQGRAARAARAARANSATHAQLAKASKPGKQAQKLGLPTKLRPGMPPRAHKVHRFLHHPTQSQPPCLASRSRFTDGESSTLMLALAPAGAGGASGGGGAGAGAIPATRAARPGLDYSMGASPGGGCNFPVSWNGLDEMGSSISRALVFDRGNW